MADGAFAEEIKEAGRRRKLKDTRVPAELLVQDGTKARIRYDDRAASDADGNATLRRRLPRSWMDLASGAGRTGVHCSAIQIALCLPFSPWQRSCERFSSVLSVIKIVSIVAPSWTTTQLVICV
jgi:hypothetical protein